MILPTYQDLMDFIPVFQDQEMDLRVFRIPSRIMNENIDEDINMGVNEDINDDIDSSIFYIGDFPVEKSYLKETRLTKEFITGEIKKIRDQWEFDKTVKPYPDRDLYYNIIIHDFESLQRLAEYWTTVKSQLVKGVTN